MFKNLFGMGGGSRQQQPQPTEPKEPKYAPINNASQLVVRDNAYDFQKMSSANSSKKDKDEEPILVKPSERKSIEVELDNFTINELLTKMVQLKASDCHFETGSQPIYRINGDMVFTNLPVITQDVAEKILYPMINESQKQIFLKTGSIDFCYEIPKLARFRANFLRHRRGMGAVFRIIPSKIPTVEESIPFKAKLFKNIGMIVNKITIIMIH